MPDDEQMRKQQALLHAVEESEKSWRIAVAHYEKVRLAHGKPDTASATDALFEASRAERLALEVYTTALKSFTDFMLEARFSQDRRDD